MVGKKRTGKTTLTRKFLDIYAKANGTKNIFVYDINNEYQDFYPEKFEEFETFLNKVVDKENSYIHFEEATIFFSTSARCAQMINMLVRSRHTNNIIQLNFHSWKSVPKNIYNLIDTVIVFKTNDSFKDVKDKFDNEKVLNAFNKCLLSSNNFEKVLINL